MPTITLTPNDDVYNDQFSIPDPNDDTIYGLAGDDSIFGSQGDDLIYGGDGSDTISSNFAVITPSVGGDTVYGGAGDDVITTLAPFFEGGTTVLRPSSVGDTVYGGEGNDSIAGAVDFDDALADDPAQDDDFLFGGIGNDTIVSNGGEDFIDGGADDDTVIAGDALSTLDGGDGIDTVSFESLSGSVAFDMTAGEATIAAGVESVTDFENVIGTGFDDTILGDLAGNVIEGGGGDDSVGGGGGSDTFVAGAGNDTVIGGEDVGDTDVDVYDFSAAASGITVVYSGDEAGTVSGIGTGVDSFSEVERIVFTDLDDNVNASADTVGVTLSTLGGDDFVAAGQGADSLDGGAGSDTLSYLDSAAGVTLNLATGTGTGGNAQGDQFVDFERFLLSDADDSLIGSAAADSVDAGGGADILDGAGGADSLSGGVGNDTVAGGTGGDTMNGNAGFDTLDYSGSAAGVTVDLAAQTATGGDATGDTFSSFEGVIGSAADDTLTGSGAANTIDAGAGDDSVAAGGGADSVDAGTGNDTVQGGAGGDSMDGGDGFDMLDYSDSADPVSVDLGAQTVTGGSGAGDSFINFEGAVGSSGNDTLTGDGTANSIDGGAGDDVIDGGAGNDTLEGGAGDDSFAGDAGDDTITGGDDADTITVGGGTGDDVVTGGEGGTDDDTIFVDRPTDGGFDVVYGGVDNESGTIFVTDDTGTTVSTITFDEIENIVCFARGTIIGTPRGPRAIEDLAAGDMVLTRDHGLQPIRWIGGQRVAARGKLAPVVIRAGALGNDRDLTVSQLHRMLVTDWRAELMFGEPEVLACAKHLVNGDTIFVAEGGEVEYYHMLFDRHEIVTANGALAESFHPGEQGMGWMEDAAREEIFAIFPQLRVRLDGFGPAARTSLKAYEARALRR